MSACCDDQPLEVLGVLRNILRPHAWHHILDPDARTYDLCGNLTSDGRFTYTWDADNRLISVRSKSGSPVAAKRWLTFDYDGFGRRIRKTVRYGTTNMRCNGFLDQMLFSFC